MREKLKTRPQVDQAFAHRNRFRLLNPVGGLPNRGCLMLRVRDVVVVVVFVFFFQFHLEYPVEQNAGDFDHAARGRSLFRKRAAPNPNPSAKFYLYGLRK